MESIKLYEELVADLNLKLSDPTSQVHYSNEIKLRLYSKIQLAILTIEEKCLLSNDKIDFPDDAQRMISQLEDLSGQLNLTPIKRNRFILDDMCRFIFINSGLYFLGVFLSLPFLFIKTIEQIFRVHINNSFSLHIRKFIGWVMLTQAGIVTETHGLSSNELNQLQESNTIPILTFTHSSNLDGFLICQSCPFHHYALAKKELFIIPFFSWISFAVGGVPVDRENRDRAIRSLQHSTELAKCNSSCIVIAPEGTRSKSGNLLPFKKGTFYIWEMLNSPIIPFISFGGYDLFPVGTWLNIPGKVVIQYLPIIQPNEAIDRNNMIRILRRKMLLALQFPPKGVGEPLSVSEYLLVYTVGFSVLFFNIIVTRSISIIVMLKFSVTAWMTFFYFILCSCLITIILYIYYLYVSPIISIGRKRKCV